MTSNHDPHDETLDFDDVTIPPVDNVSDGANQDDDATLKGPTTGEFETLPPDRTTPLESAVGTRVRYFGDYELLTEIARGGMGVVYRARQNKLNRIVALKMILAGQFASEEDVQRFYTEAAAAALLDHPGIVPVYEVGEHQGQHFFSMGFVEGTSLAARIASGPLPPREAAALLKLIAEAIAYAHSKGVIHRDLKPANVLLDKQGTPKVTDFGLAKNMESESGLTRTGSVMGTPSYMPPEQAGGKNEQVGPRSDVYSLGAMLYCLLTGRPPFQSANPLDTLLQVMTTEPVPPRQLNPQIPKDLETICVKCLQKDPSRRYESASALAADLGRYHRGEPIHARSISRSERTWRWCKRNPVVASLLAVSVTLLLMSLWSLRAESQQRMEAVTQTANAQAAESDAVANAAKAQTAESKALAQESIALRQESLAKENLAKQIEQVKETSTALLSYGLGEYEAARFSNSTAILTRAWKLRADDDPIKEPYARVIVDKLTRGGRSWMNLPHEDIVNSVAFSPDGSRVATATGGTARLWDAKTGAPLGEPMRHESIVQSVVFSPDGSRVATASYDSTARLWDAQTGAPLGEPLKHDGMVYSVAFSTDGARVATASYDATARLWDAQTGVPLGATMRHEGPVYSVVFSPDGLHMATKASNDNMARLWNAQTGALIGEPMRHEYIVNSVAFSPDGSRVATASGDATARLWDAQTGTPIGAPMRHESYVNSVAFSPDGSRVATASGDETRLWDAKTGAPLGEPMRHESYVTSVVFSPDGLRVATASGVETRLWDVQTGTPLGEPIRHEGVVTSMAISPDGSRVATASEDATARLWDAQTGVTLGEPMRHEGVVTSVAISPDGSRVATASGDATARLWDAQTGTPLGAPMRHESYVTSVAFSHDGSRVATASYDKTTRLWDAQSGAPLGEPMQHEYIVFSVVFSPDGSRVASASGDGTARLWDAQMGTPLGEPMRHENKVLSVAFSPDGSRVATASEDKTARLWDAQTGTPLGAPMRHESIVFSVVFSPDGSRVATASGVKARLWDAQTGAPLGEPMRHDGWVRSVAFSPDGTRLATASTDQGVNYFDVEQILPNDLPRFINHFTDASNSSPPWDAEFGRKLIALQSKRSLRYRQSTAIKAVADKHWFVSNFHLPWLIEHEPNDPRWQSMLAQTHAAEPKKYDEPIPSNFVDLLSLADLSTCWTEGKWSYKDGVLEEIEPNSSIEFPYTLPAEYRMTAIVEPLDNPNALCLGQRLGGIRFVVTFAYNGLNAIEVLDGKGAEEGNSTLVNANLLTQNQRSKIIVTVLANSVNATVDGREVINWTGDAASLSAIHETPNGEAMMLRSFFCRYRIHRLSVEPLSSEGKKSGPAAESGAEVEFPDSATNDQKVETLTGTITDFRLSAEKDAVALFIKIDEQNAVIVLVPPAVYAAITSSGTVLTAESLLGKTVHATGKMELYTGRNEAWKKMQQLTIDNADALRIE